MGSLAEEAANDDFFGDRERLVVANEREQIFGVVVEVVVPGVFLDAHLLFALMLCKCLVHGLAELLELQDRRQKELSSPQVLGGVLLARRHIQDRCQLFLPRKLGLILESDYLV